MMNYEKDSLMVVEITKYIVVPRGKYCETNMMRCNQLYSYSDSTCRCRMFGLIEGRAFKHLKNPECRVLRRLNNGKR
jgi:hypothetical protein